MSNKRFQESYNLLNSEQRTAVDEIDGPVLVVAGPGTGKTQLLSTRVANILQKTDASPENILCLTFTNKAALNMRERLTSLIGSEAMGVTVKTFHSFAAEVMSSYPDFFWNGAQLTTVPDAIQLEIIQSIQETLPLSNPLARKFADQFTGTKAIQDSLKLAKEAGLTPDKLESIVTANLAYIDVVEPELIRIFETKLSSSKLDEFKVQINNLPRQDINQLIAPLVSLDTVIQESFENAYNKDAGTGKSTHTSKFKQKWIKTVNGSKAMYDERNRNNWWLELSRFYKQYRDKLHQRGHYDYADMLVEVIYQLENQPSMLSDIQERFQYVLIDEFQDTNAAQLRLAHLVADHPTSNGRPNLMVVGDDDQSIYKFNGAELNNMLNFRKFYKVKKPIVLTKNYRSSQTILDIAKIIAEQATDRIVNREPDIPKELIAQDKSSAKGYVTHLCYPTREHQLSAIATSITDSYRQTTSVAVLARGHESLRAIAAILNKHNIPVRYEQQNNILDQPAIQQIVLLAEIIVAIQAGDEETVNSKLPRLLAHPMWKIDNATLWKLAIKNRPSPHWLDSLSSHPSSHLRQIALMLQWQSRRATTASLQTILEYLMGLRESEPMSSPFRDYFVSNRGLSQEYLDTLSAIKLLRGLALEFSAGQRATITDFVGFIEVNRDNNRVISDQSTFVSGNNAVELLTAHKAKGLEFDVVYIIDAIEDNWKPRTGGRKPPANLPLQPYGDDYDDYIRLMYVAATRAKHSLIATSYRYDSNGNDVLPSPIIVNAIPPVIVDQTETDTVEILETALSWPSLETTQESQLLRPVLENYQLSVTALLNFLDISRGGPQYFKEKNLLKLPETKTLSQAYGTAIHYALERSQINMNKGKHSLHTTLVEFEKGLLSEQLDAQDFDRYLEQGKQVLDRLFTQFHYELPGGSLPEQTISDIRIGKCRIGGKIDRLDTSTDNKKLVIVDYKTGKPLKNFVTKDKSKEIKAWKHRVQLIFYALLAKETPKFKGYESMECQMVYVEAESPNELVRTYVPTIEEVSYIQNVIHAVWDHVQAAKFPDVSHYSKDLQGIMQFQDDLLSNHTKL